MSSDHYNLQTAFESLRAGEPAARVRSRDYTYALKAAKRLHSHLHIAKKNQFKHSHGDAAHCRASRK